MPYISPIDTYYSYVVQQMGVLGAQVSVNGATVAQPFGGIVNARDWPQTPIVEGALYLLVLSQNPQPGGMVSQSQMGYEYFCQWVWILIGTDIGALQVSQNRADRYRQEMQIAHNLRQANYPGFTRRMDYSVNATTGVVTATPSTEPIPYSPIEMVTWNPLRFMPKVDSEKSGVSYGAAAVELHAFDDISALVA